MRRRGRGTADVRATVLLTNGEERSVLAAARGLAAASYRVSCAAGSRQAAALWSRACHEQLLLPDVFSGVAEFESELEDLLGTGNYQLMIPGTDAALLVVSEGRSRLERLTTLGLPSAEAVEAVLDKRTLLQSAATVGVRTPDSLVCQTRDEVLAAGDEFGLPVVVKARSSVTREGDRVVQHRSIVVADNESLVAATREVELPCIVQQLETQARLLSVAGVAVDGSLLAVAASRYLRTWPVRAGAAAFSETVAPPAGLVDAAGAVLERLGWHGIFELEFLETHKGDTLLIDLNPRVYGSLALAIAAGANLPAIWCDFLLGEWRTDALVTARPGMRYRWEDADIRNCLHNLRGGRLREAAAVARPRRNVSHAFGRLNDPGPLAAHALALGARRFRRWRRPPVGASPAGRENTDGR
jgi:predicted ATP-grasp superfamily ATP-dependent carboligase